MPKRPSKHVRPARPLSSSHAAGVDKADGRWMTQTMPARAAIKEYRCPGCERLIPLGTPHVVVWPVVASLGFANAVDERRHWHTSCWNRRL